MTPVRQVLVTTSDGNRYQACGLTALIVAWLVKNQAEVNVTEWGRIEFQVGATGVTPKVDREFRRMALVVKPAKDAVV